MQCWALQGPLKAGSHGELCQRCYVLRRVFGLAQNLSRALQGLPCNNRAYKRSLWHRYCPLMSNIIFENFMGRLQAPNLK